MIKVNDKVMIPQDEHPEINFVGLLIGPRGNTLKGIFRVLTIFFFKTKNFSVSLSNDTLHRIISLNQTRKYPSQKEPA